MTPDNPYQYIDGGSPVADPAFDQWLEEARAAHVERAELRDLVSSEPALTIRRAAAHIRSCTACLDLLAARVEEAVLDEQDITGAADDRSNGDAIDWRPLRPYLRHAEPVLRAAGARATVALSVHSPAVAAELERLLDDRDPLVRIAAAAVLEERGSQVRTPAAEATPVPGIVTQAKATVGAVLDSLVPPFVIGPLPLLVGRAHARDAVPDRPHEPGAIDEEAEDRPRIFRMHASPDGRLSVDVGPHAGDSVCITFSTSDPDLAAARVQFGLFEAGTSDDAESGATIIEVVLRKILGRERWEERWIGPGSNRELRILRVWREP